MKCRANTGLSFTGFAMVCAAVFGVVPHQAAAQTLSGQLQSSVRFIEAPQPVYSDPLWEGAAYAAKPTNLSDVGQSSYKIGELNQGPLNLKLSIAPQASVTDINGIEQRSGGAEVRLGSNTEPGVERNHSWFLFAGAKGRAVTWNMDSGSAFDMDEVAQLKRRATVGDFQAGLAYQLGPTQMSFGYVKRKYTSGFVTDKTNIAAFSIAWRH